MSTVTPDAGTDDDAREAIRHDLGRNLFVEAGAGTGKTTVLVDRIVNLLATGRVRDVSGLVAITFTEAAAAELRDRTRRALESAKDDVTRPAADRARCAEARRRIDEAVLTTLHGFAQRILAEHPLEAGLPPRFEVDDGVLSGVRFVERWSAFLDQLYDDPELAPVLVFAHALGLTTTHLRDIALRFHDRWDRVVEADLGPPPRLPRLDPIPVLAALDTALSIAGADRVGDPADRLSMHLANSIEPIRDVLDEAIAASDDEVVLRYLASVPAVPNGGKAAWWDGEKPAITEALQRARDEAVQRLAAIRTGVIELLMPQLRRFTAEGVDQRRADGVLEFHDLLVLARDLLAAHRNVRVALADRYEVLLIDEFQDTDPLQLDIAFMLAAADPGAEPAPWWSAVLAEGKVLIVGDPKQSIYGFRGADIGVWDRARERFAGGVVDLHRSFRSVPPIVDWVNEVFHRVIGPGRSGSQPPYRHLVAARLPAGDGPAVLLVGGEEDGRIDALRAAEAADVAALIVAARDEGRTVEDPDGPRPLRYDDVGVLLPTRAPLGHLERALDAAGVPYRVESRSLVWSTDAVRELLAVLTAVDDPGDDVAVVAALRSPGFACSDRDLLDWRAAGGRWDPRLPAPHALDEDHPVVRAMAALGSYHRERGSVPVDVLVERVVRERRLVELTFAQRRPRDHWRRLRFVVDQARAFVEAGGASLGHFLAWADLQTAEGATVVEVPAPEPDDDAVRILTVHGAKGLEFPVVALAGLGTGHRDLGPTVAWGSTRPEVMVGRIGARFATAGWATAATGADTAVADERDRLLYVAATRARDLLVVGLRHNPRGGVSHARTLHPHAEVAGAETAHALDPCPVADPPGAPGPRPATGFATVDERAAWVASYDALVAGTHAPRALSATAIAKLGTAPTPAPAREGADEREGPDTAEILDESPDDDLVVGAVEGDHVPAATASRSGGTARGRALHAVLQAVDLDTLAGVDELAHAAAGAEGIDPGPVAALARSALASPSVAEARVAPRRWRELTVTVPLGGGRLVEGYVDLVYERADGALVVVDHKSDAARTEADLDASAARYRLQLATYALALEAATGRPVARAVLVFARPDGPAVEREVVDLPAAVAEARALASA